MQEDKQNVYPVKMVHNRCNHPIHFEYEINQPIWDNDRMCSSGCFFHENWSSQLLLILYQPSKLT